MKGRLRQFRQLMHDLVRDDSAQDTVEYAFLAAFIGIAGYVTITSIVPALASTYASWIDPNQGVPRLWAPNEPASGS
jgi:Flp pilus assembly pilin Flp